jgi:poly(A) polymerase
MTLPDAAWRSEPGFVRLVDALGADEGLVRVVGGAVRDTLLRLPVSDVDLATRLLPDVVAQRIERAGFKAVPTGIAHGTVTAVLPRGPVEVTTLRRDVSTDGRRATVAFTEDWQEDAARRDFTINALSADPASGAVYDYFAGLSDLDAHVVRFIGDPLRRIAEDHLRILRFFRFHARFGQGAPDPDGLAACAARANDLMALSRERIAQELLKLLAVSDPVPTVRLMIDNGIFRPVLPEIAPEAAVRLERLVQRERATGGDALRRLAALLPPDPTKVDAAAARLKLSNAQRARLGSATQDGEPGDVFPLAYRIGVECARDRVLLHAEEPAAALMALQDWAPPRLPITGGDLISMGLPPGPIVAATLARVEEAWIAAGFPDRATTEQIAREEIDQAQRRR